MKSQKIKNYILIIIFIFFLYIPTFSYIFLKNKIHTINYEKRDYAEMPKLSLSNITSFPKQFDDYFNDHLPYRSFIINNWRNLNYVIFDESIDNRVLVGKNENNENWLFFDNVNNGDPISFIDGRKKVIQKDLDTFLSNITNQTNELKKKNVDLYYIMCPNKSTIYSQNLPSSVSVDEDYFEKVYKYLQENNVKNIYYSIDILKNASKKYETYYRTDTHWNKYGAYVYIQDFINKLYNKKLLKDPKVKQVFIESNSRDLHGFMGVSVKIKENKTDVSFDNKSKVESKTIKIKKGTATIYENKNYLIDETVLLVGDSYTIASTKYLTSIYKKVIKVQYKKYSPEDNLVDKYHPDKLFFLRVERSIPKCLEYEFL